jgi:branched-chain amino acid aminotransferase
MLELSTETRLDLAHSAARHGAGLFETVRIAQGQARHLELHLERLAAGCAFLGLETPPDAPTVEVFLRGHTDFGAHASGVLRMIAVDGRLLLWVQSFQPGAPRPVSLGRSLETLRFTGNPLNRFKTLSYLENQRLFQEAESRGHFDVIAVNEKGHLSDGGRTTLFAVMGGRIFTPPLSDGALPGIARRVLLDSGCVEEASLTWEDLAHTEAVFLANALRGVIPVEHLEGVGVREADHPAILAAAARL